MKKSSLTLTDNINTTEPTTTQEQTTELKSYSDINKNVVYYDKSEPPPQKRFKEQKLIGFTIDDNNIVKTDDGYIFALIDDNWKQYTNEKDALKDVSLSNAKEASTEQINTKAWLENIKPDDDLIKSFTYDVPANVSPPSFQNYYKYYGQRAGWDYAEDQIFGGITNKFKQKSSLNPSDRYKEFYKKMYIAKLGTALRRLGVEFPQNKGTNIKSGGGEEEIMKVGPGLVQGGIDYIATGASALFNLRDTGGAPGTPQQIVFISTNDPEKIKERNAALYNWILKGAKINNMTIQEYISAGGILDEFALERIAQIKERDKNKAFITEKELKDKAKRQKLLNGLEKLNESNKFMRDTYIKQQQDEEKRQLTEDDAKREINNNNNYVEIEDKKDLTEDDMKKIFDEPIEEKKSFEEKYGENIEDQKNNRGNLTEEDLVNIINNDVNEDSLRRLYNIHLTEDERYFLFDRVSYNWLNVLSLQYGNPIREYIRLLNNPGLSNSYKIQSIKTYLRNRLNTLKEKIMNRLSQLKLPKIDIERAKQMINERLNKKEYDMEYGVEMGDFKYEDIDDLDDDNYDNVSNYSDISEISDVSLNSNAERVLNFLGYGRGDEQYIYYTPEQNIRRIKVRKFVKMLLALGVSASTIIGFLQLLKKATAPEPFPPLPQPPIKPQPDKPMPPDKPVPPPDKPVDPNKPVDPSIQPAPTPASGTGDMGEGLERAYYIDPAEADLFAISQKQREKEDREWNEYSFVASGHGLGTVKNNPLLRREALDNMKRFKNNIRYIPKNISPYQQYLASKDHEQFTRVNFKHNKNKEIHYIPDFQNSYGKEHYEDEFYNPYIKNKKILWTNPFQNSNNTLYDRATGILVPNIENPDVALFNKGISDPKYKDIKTGEINRPNGYYGLDKNKSEYFPNDDNKFKFVYPYIYGDTHFAEFGDALLKTMKKNPYSYISKYQLAKKN